MNTTRLPPIHALHLDLPIHNSAYQEKIILPSIGRLNVPMSMASASASTLVSAMGGTSPMSDTSSQDDISSQDESYPASPKARARSASSVSTTPEVEDFHTKEEPHSPSRKWKPRKKRQCPECKLYFSNLATHKSTHLNPSLRPHVCEYCSRGFARPNDLFRHIKCHWKEIGSDKGQFKCPFKQHSSGDHCGHSSGIFSRCDTFKNHLKAIHFQYPTGVKKDQRHLSSGNCRVCLQAFDSVDDWLNNHIEKNACPYANEIKK